MKTRKVAVLGDGGWGTTLALILSQNKHEVSLWGAFEDYVAQLNSTRVNSKFLPGIKIPQSIQITHYIGQAIRDAEVIVLAVPSEYVREVIRTVGGVKGRMMRSTILSATKGIETASLMRTSEIVADELGMVKTAVLSGPTIAREVAMGIPTVAVIASTSALVRREMQAMLMTSQFRLYTNKDVTGVELGGSLKNIIAIACGISDGLGFGTNTKAALLSRGLVEIARLGKAMGAKLSTFSGISGLGDLVTTCVSPWSRNRNVGEKIGRGVRLKKLIAQMEMVAEGVPTTKSAYVLAKKYRVEVPIIQEVYRVLYKAKSPHRALDDLMTRSRKEE